MAITPAQFRIDFPAFANVAKYPDGMVALWANVAPLLMDANRWGDAFTLGQELFIAHNLTLDGMATQEASRTGLVGFAKGAVASETGDKVGVTYAAQASMDPNAGHWNSTTFGQRYWWLLRMAGAGPMQASPSPYGGIGGTGGPNSGWNYGNPTNMQF